MFITLTCGGNLLSFIYDFFYSLFTTTGRYWPHLASPTVTYIWGITMQFMADSVIVE